MVFKCSVCGYVYDEERRESLFPNWTECPMCKQPAEKFEPCCLTERIRRQG